MIKEINISDYLSTEDIDTLVNNRDRCVPTIDSFINDLLLREIDNKYDTIIYLPAGFVNIDSDVLTGDKKVSIEGAGMFSSRLGIKIHDEFKGSRLVLKTLGLWDLDVSDKSALKTISLEEVLIKHIIVNANVNHTTYIKFVGCEFANDSLVDIKKASVNINNCNMPEKVENILFYSCEGIVVTNLNSEITNTIKLDNSTLTDIVSSNIKYETTGDSIVLNMKQARLYDIKEMTEAFDLTTIRTNCVISVPKGVKINGVNLDRLVSTDAGNGNFNNSTEEQTNYRWIIEVNVLSSPHDYIVLYYKCIRGGGNTGENIITRIIKTYDKTTGVTSNF